ncbi:UDP-N-acetylmuramate dehydrogenase [Candidatus Uhrbacteria bacterium]|nr:UDP-N-acetylmuramate dehydrogenase [Candidatus Uhrbacteria bacterium]
MTEALKHIVGSRVLQDEPLSKHTNFRIGGPAKWLVEVRTVDELKSVIALANEHQVPFVVFGGGSNTLASDKGYDGIVIKIAMRTYEIHGTTVVAQAGVLSSALARATANAGLSGLTWAISLPGTVGGAVRGNAGCFGGEMKDRLVSIVVLRGGKVDKVAKVDLVFGYRESKLKHTNDIVLSATFELEQGDTQELKAELDDKLMKRKSSQPLDAGSAGCLFKNYEIQDESELQRLFQKLDIPHEMMSARRLSAGWLIDQLDLKGTQIGQAKISDKHGNFVVNLGGATADHVVQLIALIKTRVRNGLGIQLEEEVAYLGFN